MEYVKPFAALEEFDICRWMGAFHCLFLENFHKTFTEELIELFAENEMMMK